MAKLKVPSLQHLARIWRNDPEAIKKVLVRLATHGPTFSYAQLFKIVQGMLVFGTPYEDALESVRRIKRDDVRENFLELMPLIEAHFSKDSSAFVHEVSPRLYSISRDIQIPFAPPLVYGTREGVVFPWLSFWRINPLRDEALSLFVTIVDELILQDSDLEDADFQILDFSAPGPRFPREFNLIAARDIPRIADHRKKEMLGIFAEGYRMAKAHLEVHGTEHDEAVPEHRDENQMPLF